MWERKSKGKGYDKRDLQMDSKEYIIQGDFKMNLTGA